MSLRARVVEWLTFGKALLGFLVLAVGTLATCSGWLNKAIKTPERVEHLESQFERWIMYQNLDRCERDGIPPTECDPLKIPEPGGDG